LRLAARQSNLALLEPEDFKALPGMGVKARVDGHVITVGNIDFIGQVTGQPVTGLTDYLPDQGKTLLCVAIDGKLAGALAAADAQRPEVPQAIQELRQMGITKIELLTGDYPGVAASLAERLDIPFRAGLLPEDKIRIVKEYQAKGHSGMVEMGSMTHAWRKPAWAAMKRRAARSPSVAHCLMRGLVIDATGSASPGAACAW
jgi:Cd2+/Zn2+-exporting ATPase/Cu+-exporting ATPase